MNLDLDNVEGAGRRLQPRRCSAEGAVAVGERRLADAAAARQAARPRDRAAERVRAPAPATVKVRITRPGRLRARTQLRAERQAGDAGADAPHGASRSPRARASRCRTTCSPIWCRAPARWRCRSAPRPRSTPRRCSRRSTAIRSAAPSRSPAGRCRCSMSTSSRAPRIWRSTTPSTSASATPSTACWRASRRTARSASGASAATTPGSTPMSPTS